MKLLVVVLTFFVLTCSVSKKAIENEPNGSNKDTTIIEVPNIVKTEPKIDDGEIEHIIVSVDNEELTIAEIESEDKTEALLKEKKDQDSLNNFHQKLTKRILTEHELWNELSKAHVSEYGSVDYAGFRKDYGKLQGYIRILQSLENINSQSRRTKEDKLAYWINAYNALTIDLILRNYPTKSIKDIKDPWDQRLWKFGDKWLNLNDIEHEILRKMDEPRIHFAIVCASISCPKLQNEAFTSSRLEEQLTLATKEFLSDTSKNKLSDDRIEISKIFKWFKKDFEQNGSLIDFLNEYSNVKISKNAKKSYTDYNWDLND